MHTARTGSWIVLLLAGCTGDVVHPGKDIEPGKRPDRPPVVVIPVSTPLDETCQNALTGPFNEALPVPTDIVVSEDDNSVRMAWDGLLARGHQEFPGVEGYRICWGTSTTSLTHAALFTWRRGQLFGVPNGEPQVAIIQAVDMYGNISRPSEAIAFTGNPARIDQMASEMSGFFDDFNMSEGALDESMWNVAFSQCNDPTASHTYVNNQQHAVSVLGNSTQMAGSVPGCDRDQNVARPRAVFDFTNREGRITFDFDGSVGGRSTWYLDVFPYEGPSDLLDITGHVTFDPGAGHPGRFLRFAQSANHLRIHQHGPDGQPVNMVEREFHWDSPESHIMPGQVMRSWELRVSKNRAAVYIDGVMILEHNDVGLDFERGIVHWAQFGYNPIKEGNPWHMFHWDNFGFDGPRQEIHTNNYKSSFTRDDMRFIGWPDYANTWTVNIPDSLAGASSARFFYTIQTPNYAWAATDTFTLNGTVFPIPEPMSPTGTWQDGTLGTHYPPFSTSVEIPLSSLVTGVNTFSYEAGNTQLLNQHIEVYFPEGAERTFTQPHEYVEKSAVPHLDPIGPSLFLNMVNGQQCNNGDGVMDIAKTDLGGDQWLRVLETPLSGTATFNVAVENSRPLRMFGQNLGIARIELLVDGELASVTNTARSVPAPRAYDGMWEWNQSHNGGAAVTLDTTLYSNGEHEILFLAYDGAGTVSRAWTGVPGHREPITITINN